MIAAVRTAFGSCKDSMTDRLDFDEKTKHSISGTALGPIVP